MNNKHLRELFERLDKFGLVINPSKCLFGVESLEFLGHLITKEGIQPLDSKVIAIRDFPTPSSLTKLREFLGLMHQFLPKIHPQLCSDLPTTN